MKSDGILPDHLNMDDINISFYDGRLDDHAMGCGSLESESDEEPDFGAKMEEAMSRPITYYVIISENNKLYNTWCGIELLLCVLSSYFYAYKSTFSPMDHYN